VERCGFSSEAVDTFDHWPEEWDAALATLPAGCGDFQLVILGWLTVSGR
jgi:hypothetical protein